MRAPICTPGVKGESHYPSARENLQSASAFSTAVPCGRAAHISLIVQCLKMLLDL